MPIPWISLSDFSRFIRCKKYFFLYKNSKRPCGSSLEYTLHTIAESQITTCAHALFPGGVHVTEQSKMEDRLGRTQMFCKEWARDFNGAIFTPWFTYSNVSLYIDILNYQDGWHATAIQNRGGISTLHSLELALQVLILQKNDIELKSFSILYADKKYVRGEDIDPNSLFKKRECLDELFELIPEVEKIVSEISKPLTKSETDLIDIGAYCLKPAPCPFMSECWKHIPENSVFDIATLDRDSKFNLYKKGILSLKDVNPGNLPEMTPVQTQQIESAIQKSPVVQINRLKDFLRTIHYPVYYLDFESIMPIVPLFKGTKPFQHVPMQYSLFEKKDPSSETIFREFLADPPHNPSKTFIESLLNHIGTEGSILVYDRRHEARQLHDLLQVFPEMAEKIHSVLERMVDLIYPFQKRFYYSPAMKGLSSLKNVLPALVPSLSYESLSIKKVYSEFHALESLFYESDPDVIKTTMLNLKEYSRMDTYAMVKIHEFLVGLFSGK